MFLLYFLDAYINMGKILHHTGSIQKQTSAGIRKRMLEAYWLRKNNQGRLPKLSVWQKRNILRQTKRLQEEMGNFFVKWVMVKAGIPLSIR